MAVYEHPGAGGGNEDARSGNSEQSRGKYRSWQEWMMFAMGLVGLLSVLAIILSISAIASNSSSPSVMQSNAAASSSGSSGSGASMNSSMKSSMGSGQSNAAAGGAAAPAGSSKTEAVKLTIKSDEEKGKLGSDGKYHDAYLPANFTVHAGDTVHVTVLNYDDMPHTFTSPTLSSGVNVTIKKGSEKTPSKTTFTFTAPAKTGKYLWWCALPCDPYSMAHIGFMRGYVTVSA